MLPKVLGTYESELHPAIEEICRSRCDRIIDIGAAEGYYAVGMALRNPEAAMIGFEMSAPARHLLRRLARRNGVSDRIALRGACSIAALDTALAGARQPAVICDCEGAEDVLLRPDRVKSLRHALLLVETHEGMVDGVTRRLRERFFLTHQIEVIDSRPRSGDDLPSGCTLSSAEADQAMDEYRRWAQWYFMRPKASQAPHDPGVS